MVDSLLIVAIVNMFFFGFLLWNLGNQEPEKELDVIMRTILKMFYIAAILLSLYTTAHLALINSNHCEFVPINEMETYVYGNNLSGYHWDDYSSASTPPPQVTSDVFMFHTNTTYTYDWVCADEDANIYTSYFKFINWIMRVFMLYVIIYVLAMIYKASQIGIKKLQNK